MTSKCMQPSLSLLLSTLSLGERKHSLSLPEERNIFGQAFPPIMTTATSVRPLCSCATGLDKHTEGLARAAGGQVMRDRGKGVHHAACVPRDLLQSVLVNSSRVFLSLQGSSSSLR